MRFLQQLFQSLVTHVIKEAFDVRVADPVHFPRSDDPAQSRQRLVTRFPRAITVRGVVKVDFVDWLQDHHDRTLDQFVLHASDAQRSRFPIPFGDVLPQTWLGAIAAAVKAIEQVMQVASRFSS